MCKHMMEEASREEWIRVHSILRVKGHITQVAGIYNKNNVCRLKLLLWVKISENMSVKDLTLVRGI